MTTSDPDGVKWIKLGYPAERHRCDALVQVRQTGVDTYSVRVKAMPGKPERELDRVVNPLPDIEIRSI